MKQLTISILILLILFACSKNPTEQKDDPKIVVTDSSVVVTVTPGEKTVIEFKDNTIIIPEDAVTQEGKITITYANEELDPNEDSKTKAIKLKADVAFKDTIFIEMINPDLGFLFGVGIIKDIKSNNCLIIKPSYRDGKVIIPYFKPNNSSTFKKTSGWLDDLIIDYLAEIVSDNGIKRLTQDMKVIIEGIDTNSNEPVLFLVHGLSSSSYVTWEKDVGETGNNFLTEAIKLYKDRVIMFDYPSGHPISENAEALYGEINRLIYSKNSEISVDIIAHSMGGLVSRKMSLNHPGKIRNLITLGSPHNGAVFEHGEIIHTFDLEVIQNPDLTITILTLFYPGGQDIFFESPFINELNTVGGNVKTNYLTLAGTKRGFPFLGGEDGLVNTYSADLTHPDFPKTREVPETIDSEHYELTHGELANGSYALLDKIKEFITLSNSPFPSENLVNYYSFENNLEDAIGNNNGTLHNGAGFENGKIGFAGNFDGIDDYGEMSSNPLGYIGNGNYSFNLWFNPYNTSKNCQYFLELGKDITGVSDEFTNLGINDQQLRGQAFFGNWSEIILLDGEVSNSAWQMATFVREQNIWKIYLNGEIVDSGTHSGIFTSEYFNKRMIIAGSTHPPTSSVFFGGLIDELGIWKRALSADDIINLYNSGNGMAYIP